MDLSPCLALLLIIPGIFVVGLIAWGIHAHFKLVRKMDWRNQTLVFFLSGVAVVFLGFQGISHTRFVPCGETRVEQALQSNPTTKTLIAAVPCPCGCGCNK